MFRQCYLAFLFPLQMLLAPCLRRTASKRSRVDRPEQWTILGHRLHQTGN